MNRCLRLVLLIFSVSLQLIRCSSNNMASNSGGVSVPNGITGMVVDNGNPVSDQEVVLKEIVITSSGDSAVFTDTSYSDKDGEYLFSDIAPGMYIVVSHGTAGSGIISRMQRGDQGLDRAPDMELNNTVDIKGRIPGGEGGEVFIPGTGKSSVITESGFYVLEDIPAGRCELAFVDDGVCSYIPVDLFPGSDTVFIRDVDIRDIDSLDTEGYSIYTHKALNGALRFPEVYHTEDEPDWYTGKDFSNAIYTRIIAGELSRVSSDGTESILISDFDRGYPYFSSGLWRSTTPEMDVLWYGFDGSERGMGAVLDPDLLEVPFESAITEGGPDGNSLNLKIYFTPSQDNPSYGGAGFYIKSSKDHCSLQDLDTISFDAKGTGDFRVQLGINPVDTSADQGDMFLTSEVTLNPSWQSFSIPADDFLLGADSIYITRQEALKRIELCHFVSSSSVVDTSEIWLDNLVFKGLSAKDLD